MAVVAATSLTPNPSPSPNPSPKQVEQLKGQRARVAALERELAGGDSAATQRAALLEAEVALVRVRVREG